MKKKIAAIMCCAAVIFCAGLSVAYYNTKTFGFDENTKLVSYDEEKISFMDFNIYYSDISDLMDKAISIIPEKTQTI